MDACLVPCFLVPHLTDYLFQGDELFFWLWISLPALYRFVSLSWTHSLVLIHEGNQNYGLCFNKLFVWTLLSCLHLGLNPFPVFTGPDIEEKVTSKCASTYNSQQHTTYYTTYSVILVIPVCESRSPDSGCSPASSCDSAGQRCGFCCGGGYRGWTPIALRSACASWWGSGSHCEAGWWSGPREMAALPKRAIGF